MEVGEGKGGQVYSTREEDSVFRKRSKELELNRSHFPLTYCTYIMMDLNMKVT